MLLGKRRDIRRWASLALFGDFLGSFGARHAGLSWIRWSGIWSFKTASYYNSPQNELAKTWLRTPNSLSKLVTYPRLDCLHNSIEVSGGTVIVFRYRIRKSQSRILRRSEM